jgi:transposase
VAKQLVREGFLQIIEPMLPVEPEKTKGGKPRVSKPAALKGICWSCRQVFPLQ